MSKDTKMHNIEDIEERVILVGVEHGSSGMDEEACIDELEELAQTAGANAVGRLIQKREGIHPAHYIGSGKIDELKTAIAAYDANGIICDDELSPSQMKNLEKLLGVKIMDRTMLILDIFAQRAISSEGKIQVELAQLKYRLSRLTGIGASMSRLGGGIGTRGPGEKKLESDRRYIKERISELNSDLSEIETHRKLIRNQRDKKGMPVVSLVGYTNAGKSTLLNALTNAGVLAEDKLFATLDTTTRKVKLPSGSDIMLTDTVGFIQKLPHQLIQAFKATLEELKYADVLLHVVDSSSPNRMEQIDIVNHTLKELGCEGTIPIITVFNKMDKDIDTPLPINESSINSVKISAVTGDGLENLLSTLEELLKSFRKSIKAIIPYSEGSMLSYIHGKCDIIEERHTENGTYINAYVNSETENRLKKCGFIIKE